MTKTDDIDEAIARVLDATTKNFEELVTIAGLDPATDFRYANLSEIDFSGSNLAGFDFTGAIFVEAVFSNARIAGATFTRSEELDVQLRSAIDAAEILGSELRDLVDSPATATVVSIPASTKGTANTQARSRNIERRRNAIIAALAAREEMELDRVTGASYQSPDGATRAVCALSTRHERPRPHYWYGHSPERREFLSKGLRSFVVLGSIDREVAYAIPNDTFDKVLERLHRTGDRHWHIVLEEAKDGSLSLLIPNEKSMSLGEFLLVGFGHSR